MLKVLVILITHHKSAIHQTKVVDAHQRRATSLVSCQVSDDGF
jgi:hypothetical protein